MRKLVLRIEHDGQTESPFEFGNDEWEFVSFCDKHAAYKNPEQFNNIGMARNIKSGTAFVLDYFEHGNCVWSLAGNGPQCRWDTSNNAGLLIWRGKPKDLAKTADKRREIAARVLETYTQWCNGECYYYIIETNDGTNVGSCGGFIGADYLFSCLGEVLQDGDYVKLEGDCKDMVQYQNLPEGVEVVDGFDDVPDDERSIVEIRIVLDGPNGTIYWPRYKGDEDLSETSLELTKALEWLQKGIPFTVACADLDDKSLHWEGKAKLQRRHSQQGCSPLSIQEIQNILKIT